MKKIYNYIHSPKSNYLDYLLENAETTSLLQNEVKERLLDEPQRKGFLAAL